MYAPILIYEVFERDAVYDSLFGHCSPASIFRIGRTCRAGRRAAQHYARRTFDINKHLGRFFSDPLKFRALQARTGLVVSGSNALQFMDRTVYPDSDLDLYVSSKNAPLVCKWIVENGGKEYRFVPSGAQIAKGIRTVQLALLAHRQREDVTLADIDERASFWDFYHMNRIRQVLNFESAEGLDVQVIVSHNTPMECILSFHSTVVMNLITYRAAYSLYPRGTFEEGLMLPCDTREVNHDPGIEKYIARGWTVTNLPFGFPGSPGDNNDTFVLGKRWVGDALTWVIPFRDVADVLRQIVAPEELELNEVLKDRVILNSFSLMYNLRRGMAETRFSILKPSFFADRYTACPESVPKVAFWFETIHQLTRVNRDNREAWDSILYTWKKIFERKKCICLYGGGREQYRVCPAFIEMFREFGPLTDSYLIDGIGALELE
ncbi:hypothetical protein DFH11DRAFT_1246336 [Phellopilus nigrolimitatus]|nr:hypothetical protein DFH11DRAFT_1246336 [Phellopilus nigrolimitatus]